MLKYLDLHVAWLILGDANMTFFQNEKFGGCPKNPSKLIFHSDILHNLGLFDVKWGGAFYTWSNSQN